jgi:hypothetical protein
MPTSRLTVLILSGERFLNPLADVSNSPNAVGWFFPWQKDDVES